jgi:hypothetical protein
MARQAKHSKNWGGSRPGSGVKKGARLGPNRMTVRAVTMAEQADIHPFTFLLSVIADKKVSLKDRLFASSAALPYCLSKQATQLIVHNDMEGKSDEELHGRLLTIRNELLELGTDVLEGELVVNGSGKGAQVNGA